MPVSALAPCTPEQTDGREEDGRFWTLQRLHDSIGEEIARRGPQLPCRESMSIAGAFRDRFGTELAVRIFLAAFGPSLQGMWMGAPVTWRRFAASNDEFFSCRIRDEMLGS